MESTCRQLFPGGRKGPDLAINPANPHNNRSRRTRLDFDIYCDESGTGGHAFYGFGALWIPATKRPEFQALFEHATAEAPYPGSEVKWQRTKRQTLSTYRNLVDLFFQVPWLGFHCIVVRQGWVDLDLHGRDRDLGRRKHFTQFLANKMRSCGRAHRDRDVHFTVHADEPFGGSGYSKAHEAAEVVGNHMLAQACQRRPIDAVGIYDSKTVAGIQLCDLLLGAVMDGWNHGSLSDPKQRIHSLSILAV